MDFEEWFKSHRYSDVPLCYGAAKDAFKAGRQSKQAEIDELQKRIDTALWHLENHEGYDDLTHVIKILKGELK